MTTGQTAQDIMYERRILRAEAQRAIHAARYWTAPLPWETRPQETSDLLHEAESAYARLYGPAGTTRERLDAQRQLLDTLPGLWNALAGVQVSHMQPPEPGEVYAA